MIAVAIGEMVGSDQVPDRQITSEPFGWVMATLFQLERNGALSCVNSEVCPKVLDTADIVREAIYRQSWWESSYPDSVDLVQNVSPSASRRFFSASNFPWTILDSSSVRDTRQRKRSTES